MLCPKCGKENEDDASLCTQCGATLGKQDDQPAKMSSRRKSIVILAIAGIVVVILALIGVCIAFIDLAPIVGTADATNITDNSATLNGELAGLGTGKSVDVSFQWGTSSGSYANETEVTALTSKEEFHSVITGLTPDTTYYYRTKAVGNGTDYGPEKSFTTLSP